jgi:hypothetical protein
MGSLYFLFYVPEMTSRLFYFFRRYCEACTKADPTRIMTFKTPARKSSRKRTQRDYANLNSGLGSDPNRWLRMLETKEIKKDPFKRLQGSDLESWLEDDEDALREPIIIEQPEGLGMKMPPKDLTVEHVAEYIGEDTPLEVIGKPLVLFHPAGADLLHRCCLAINLTGLESGQMGRLRRPRTLKAG